MLLIFQAGSYMTAHKADRFGMGSRGASGPAPGAHNIRQSLSSRQGHSRAIFTPGMANKVSTVQSTYVPPLPSPTPPKKREREREKHHPAPPTAYTRGHRRGRGPMVPLRLRLLQGLHAPIHHTDPLML